jgi:hypothetical protein
MSFYHTLGREMGLDTVADSGDAGILLRELSAKTDKAPSMAGKKIENAG